jgi:8-oxo-dGTP pyrophosphatase MutT (NUDIX family)
MTRFSHCHFCGAAYSADVSWPRRCAACGQTHWRNPIPVAVMIQPVEDGVLTIRRAIPPGVGQLALPGGYIDHGEDWRAAAVRELAEETGVRVSAADVTLLDVASTSDGPLLVFARGPQLRGKDLPTFVPSDETSGMVVVRGPTELVFPLHTQALAAYFARR